MMSKDAYSIEEFCNTHSIGRAKLYKLWIEGKGPKKMKVGRRTLISREAAAEWRKDIETNSQSQ